MSFSASTKDELARIVNPKKCCQLAELAALIKMDGTIEISGHGKLALKIVTENAAAARKVFKLLKKLFNIHTQVMVHKKIRLKKNNIYYIKINSNDNLLDVLKALGMINQEGFLANNISQKIIKKPCCKKAYLRGAFLGGGSVNNPETDYHLEIITTQEEYAQELSNLMKKFYLSAKISNRKNWYIVYLKESEQIVEFLNVIGAHTALLNFENVRIYKGMRNQVNRIVNCETANLNKTVNAAVRQIENIKMITSSVEYQDLSPALKEAAEIRLKNPEASLKELGEMMNPRVGKSGVSHRLRKLEEIAQRFRKRKEPRF